MKKIYNQPVVETTVFNPMSIICTSVTMGDPIDPDYEVVGD